MEKIRYYEANRIVLIVNFFLDVALIGGYIGEIIKGQKTVGMVVGFIAIILLAYAVNIAFYIKEPSHPWIKYSVIYGFLVVYTYAMLTSERVSTYIYILVLLVLYFMYLDYKLINRVAILILAINSIKVGYMCVGLGLTSNTMVTEYTIQLFAVGLICMGIILGTRFEIRNSKREMDQIIEANKAQEEAMQKITQVGRLLDSHCSEVYQTIDGLENSSQTISSAIEVICEATQEASMKVEKQKELTQQIDDVIYATSEASKKMTQMSDEVVQTTSMGEKVVKGLSGKTEEFSRRSNEVYKTVIELEKRADQIEGIINTISNIASQTNILALNATIESARVGEAGKGFAVVAGEVKELAEQTTKATSDITKIIEDLQGDIKAGLQQLSSFKTISEEQVGLIEETAKIFEVTSTNVHDCEKNIKEVAQKIEVICSANQEIIRSIEDISKNSEETMAGVEETAATTQENKDKAAQTKVLAKELVDLSEQLKAYI